MLRKIDCLDMTMQLFIVDAKQHFKHVLCAIEPFNDKPVSALYHFMLKEY